ncbi:MAG: lamin tail domain-containing protein [Ardenticatenaceae bacterium]|nr:lamin tail domain-containing protein [Anaerolineales bacterium]MCB8921333.1 lamin tail domain-containing protein [Ardenticatenaceae bacterium]MCB9004044.1 lamin tail domain-containing protein [Ardenticatenaceae bacterium]
MFTLRAKLFLLLILSFMSFVVISLSSPIAHAQVAGDILIVEVGADPNGNDTLSGAEFIEIYNASGSSMDLTGWTIEDNTSSFSIPLPSLILDNGKILVIVMDVAAITPGGFYNCTSTPLNYSPTTWFPTQLDNNNDRIILRDSGSTIIDAVSYGTDTTAFSPAATDVFDNSGATLQRQTYNTNFTDNDNATDWIASPGVGTPCDVSPTAVTLQSFNTTNSAPLLAVVVAGGLLLGTAVFITRRRTQ